MEICLPILIGILVSSGVWLILQPRLFQIIIGFILLSNAINFFIFSIRGLKINAVPILKVTDKVDAASYTDPMIQSLILTAIVINLAMTGLMIIVFIMMKRSEGNDQVDAKGSNNG